MKKHHLLGLFALCALISIVPNHAQACCFGCPQSDCDSADDTISDAHDAGGDGSESEKSMVPRTKFEFKDDLNSFQDWLVEVMWKREFAPASAALASQMAAVAMQYTQAIGMFMDAKIQMDTARVFSQLKYEAHSDYQTSEDFCWFGSTVKSMAASDMQGRYNALALGEMSMQRQLGQHGQAGDDSHISDLRSRWDQFKSDYCDTRDNNAIRYSPLTGNIAVEDNTGLELACGNGAGITARINKDVDYTRLIEEPRTLDVDFTNGSISTNSSVLGLVASATSGVGSATGTSFASYDEEDVIALSKNLYGHNVLSRSLNERNFANANEDTKEKAKRMYLALRGVAARRSVAQASFNAIVGLKSFGSSEKQDGVLYDFRGLDSSSVSGATFGAGLLSASADSQLAILNQTQRYMAAVMAHLMPVKGNGPSINLGPLSINLEGGNILEFIGLSPSYYSQLEILAKRIYQIPTFYSNLYDTPANVARKKVAMQAIELMVDREIYESQLRREMSLSVLLSTRLRPSHRTAQSNLMSAGNDN